MRMIKCRQCGKEEQAGSAIMEIVSKKKLYFCSKECGDLYLNKEKLKTEKDQCYEIILSITNRGIPVVYKVFKN